MRQRILKLLVTVMIVINTGSVVLSAETNIPFTDAKLDVKQQTVKITGSGAKNGEFVNIYLTDPSGNIEHYRSIDADGNGDFLYSFKLNTTHGEAYGSYEGWCEFVSSGHRQTIEIYLPGTEEVASIISELKSNTISVLSDAAKAQKLGVSENEIFNAVNKEKLALFLSPVLESIQYEEVNAYEQFTKICEEVKRYSVLEAYNEGLDVYLYDDENMHFKKNTALDIAAIDTKNNVTFYSCFENQLSKKGREAVLESLLRKNFKNPQELERAFCESAIIQGVKNPENNVGYDHILKLFTEKNAAAVELILSKGMNNSIAAAMANNVLNVNSINDLQKLYDNAVKPSPEVNNSPDRNRGTGSSAPMIKNNTELKNNFGQELYPVPVVKSNFTDVDDVDWAIEAINHLNERNIMTGDGNGKFEPNRPITREEMLKLVCLVVGIEESNAPAEFSDVDPTAWYYPHISGAIKAEIVNGLGDGSFGIGHPVSREDLCVMLYRAENPDKLENSKLLTFTDAECVSEYAKEAVGFMNSIGVISGYPDGKFAPQGKCTRAEAAKLIYAFMNWKG